MLLRLAAIATSVALVVWLGGFVWFVRMASRPAAPVPLADGIVVLTGGSNRIDQGLRLLAEGQAPLLLVSGVRPGSAVAPLARGAGVDEAAIAGKVTLGQSAISTRGNAEEAQEWVRRYSLHSLIVVTAFYHMPRALAELRRALPGVTLYPDPVLPDPLVHNHSERRRLLLAKEYTKWLFVELGLPQPTADLRLGEGLK